MANNSGTLVISPIRPQSEDDTFPSAFANEIKGGLHSVADLVARDAISSDRRQEGMMVYVLSDQNVYQLKTGIDNANWESLGSVSESEIQSFNAHIADDGKHREINDDGSSITDLWSADKIATAISDGVAAANELAELTDVEIDSVADNEVLAYDNGTGGWVNQTAAEAGLAAASHNHSASDVTSGSFADARVSQSSVTQHQASLSITESQVSNLGDYLENLVEDTTPQLGGTLDAQSNKITSLANGTDANDAVNKAQLDTKAGATTVNNHVADTNNPHSVTKSQVALSNVPNLDTTTAVNQSHAQNTDTGTTLTSFQINSGASGPRIKNSSGTLQVRNSADSAAAAFSAAAISGTTGTFSSAVSGTTGAFSSTLAASNAITATRNSITTTSTDGLVLQNSTAATSAVPVQQSPRIRLRGSAWKTSVTAASQTHDYIIENVTKDGATGSSLNSLSKLHVRYSNNGSAYTDSLTVDGFRQSLKIGNHKPVNEDFVPRYCLQSGNNNEQEFGSDSSIQAGINNKQIGANAAAQFGLNNIQSGTKSIQAGGQNTQSSQGSSQSGYLNTQTGDFNSQSGFTNTQSGRYSSQSGLYHTQSGNYGCQFGGNFSNGLNDGGNNHCFMFGEGKTAGVGSAAYLWVDNGIRIKPVSVAPSSPETGTLYYDSRNEQFREYQNGNFQTISVYRSTVDPTPNDDSASTGSNGTFAEGDRWYNKSTREFYICVDATTGAADWRLIPVTNVNGEIEGPIIARESTGNDIPIESELVVFNNELRLGDNLTQNGVKIGHPQNTDTGTTSASFQVNSANQTSGPGTHSFQSGHVNAQSGSYNLQSGYLCTQSGNYNSQSAYSCTQSGNYNSQSGFYSSQSGRGNTQSGFSNTQSGLYGLQSGYFNSQSGRYGLQAGRSLDDNGNNYCYMFGLNKPTSVNSAAYFWVDNGIRLKPVASAPSSPENGTLYYDSATHKFRGYANGTWVDLH